jgi:3-dehydroquinate dehydratase
VLENHHAAMTFKILQNPNADILKNLDKNQYGSVKKYMVNNILATDNKEHFVQLSRFEVQVN